MLRIFRLARRLSGDQSGAAAIELGAVGMLLAVGLMNTVDVGRYAHQTSEVNAAAQAGAEAALVTCDLTHTPATLNCSGLNGAVAAAIQASPLGSQVSLDGSITEGYYCLNTTGGLAQVGTASNKPSDCSAIADPAPGAAPTLYLQVPVTCPFQPLFPGLTLAQSFATAIKRTAWMRMA